MNAISNQLHILLIENVAPDAAAVEHALVKSGLSFVSQRAVTRAEVTQALRDFNPDIILSAHDLPDMDSPTVIEMARQHSVALPVIIVSGTLTDVAAANLIRAGACDYILKDRIARLGAAVRRAIAERDINRGRLQAEMALRASEARFRTLVESSPDVIWEMDQSGLFSYVSPHVQDLLGYDSTDLIGKSPLDFVPPREREHWKSIMDDAFAALGRFHVPECEQRHRNGHYIIVEVTGVAFFDEKSGVGGYRGITRDITRRKEAERALGIEQAVLKTEHELSPDAILVVDANGTISSYNQRFLDLWHVAPEDAARGIDKVLLEAASTLTVDPDAFHARVRYIYDHPDESGFEEIALKDGRVFQRYTAAARDSLGAYLGRVWYFRDITDRRRAEEQLAENVKDLAESLEATVAVIANTVEARDPYTAGHQRRVAKLACAIATEMGLSSNQIDGIRVGGLLHDLGKIHVPAEILSKPGRLSLPEYELLKTHPQAGYDILKGVKFPWPVAEIAWQHHERIDGNGYPRGLKGDEILLEARILAVADVAEAMIAHRPYRPGLGIELALAELDKGKGVVFDTAAVTACIKILQGGNFKFDC